MTLSLTRVEWTETILSEMEKGMIVGSRKGSKTFEVSLVISRMTMDNAYPSGDEEGNDHEGLLETWFGN